MERKKQSRSTDRIVPRTDRPLIEILGDRRVLIEHHKGVSVYESTLMQVKVCFGFLEILGSDLTISCMSVDRLVIIGKIEGMRILRGSK